ncbi:847_t:CDS:2 [Funneliformis mosseae]|uniref:847_t:CDS:1 n=1 Tax=Funneliformis mosseae TaxID=27381 RepID=A0A9N8WPX8_FUNMO|nr:847_t:CDS:2 [Funneliformis mosseae]
MDELLQSRPLAQSNRDYERQTYNLEQDIVLRNTPKAYNQTVKLIDENERLKREIDTLKYNLRDRDNKLAQKKTRITDLHCQNFALTLLRYQDRVELINTQETLQNAQIWNVKNEYESDENSQDNINEKQPSSKISSCCTTVIQDTAQDTETLESLEEWHALEGFDRSKIAKQAPKMLKKMREL